MAVVLFGYADQPSERNTSVHRCEVPARILSETGRHQCGLLHISHLQNPHPPKEVQDAINSSEIIILERLLLADLQPRIEEWHKAGKKVVSTFDDAYHLMPKSGGISEQTWRGGKKVKVGTNADGTDKVGSILNEFRQTLRMVDTALVPSRVLADDYRAYCPTIQYVPNFLHKGLWENLKRRPIDNNFIIGWGGSTAHSESFAGSHLPQALGIIAKRYPRVHIHLQTRDPKILIMLDKANLQGRYTSALWVPFEIWPQIVYRWDLYVIPLSGEYDERRSALKVEEAGMANIPFVATDAPPYHEYDAGGILVENRTEAWVSAISKMIDDKEAYAEYARKGHEWALAFSETAVETYEQALSI